LRVLTVGAFVSAVLGADGRALIGLDRNRVVMYSTLVAAALNVILNVALIPVMGILGAAIASTIAISIRNGLNLGVLYRSHEISPVSSSAVRPTLVAIGVAGVLLVGLSQLELPLVLGAIAWTALYPVILIRFGGIRPADKRFVGRIEDRLGTEFTTVRSVFKRYEADG
jgi:O-antigen/teichoic acid export membrane protein